MSRRRQVLAAVALAALVVIVARVVPGAAAHRTDIRTAAQDVAACVLSKQRPGESGLRTVGHLAGCVLADDEVRGEAGDLAVTAGLLVCVGVGSWSLVRGHRVRQGPGSSRGSRV